MFVEEVNIKPMQDWVCLRRHEYQHPSLFVAGQSTHRGTVVATGPGKRIRRWKEVEDPINGKRFRARVGAETGKLEPMDVKPGDIVEYSNYGWEQREIDGQQYIFVRQGSIIGFDDASNPEGIQGHVSAVVP